MMEKMKQNDGEKKIEVPRTNSPSCASIHKNDFLGHCKSDSKFTLAIDALLTSLVCKRFLSPENSLLSSF